MSTFDPNNFRALDSSALDVERAGNRDVLPGLVDLGYSQEHIDHALKHGVLVRTTSGVRSAKRWEP